MAKLCLNNWPLRFLRGEEGDGRGGGEKKYFYFQFYVAVVVFSNEEGNVKAVSSSRKQSVPAGLLAPQNGELNSRNVSNVDREFEELLRDVNNQDEENSKESLEGKNQEASTETGILKYDELR